MADAASEAQAVIDLMNQMDADAGVAAPVAQPATQPQTGGLFNFLAGLPVLGGFLKPDAQPLVKPKAKAKVKAAAPLGGAAGALMQRKMLNEALRGGGADVTDEQLIEMMSMKR